MTLAHAAPDHRHARQHHFHRVGDDVARAALLEAVHADLHHAAVAALMEPDRHVEFFGHHPELLVIRMMDHLVVVRVGPQEHAAESELLARVAHLLDCEIDRLHRYHRNAEQPIGIRLAVIREPSVVCARHRRRGLRVRHRAGEQADAGIQERGIDAVEIHVGDARVRIEAALASLLVLHGIVHHGAVARTDAAKRAEALFAAEQLFADLQALLAVGVADQLGRKIAVFGIHVVIPERQRLQDVSIGVDDVIGATHGWSPSGSTELRLIDTCLVGAGSPWCFRGCAAARHYCRVRALTHEYPTPGADRQAAVNSTIDRPHAPNRCVPKKRSILLICTRLHSKYDWFVCSGEDSSWWQQRPIA